MKPFFLITILISIFSCSSNNSVSNNKKPIKSNATLVRNNSKILNDEPKKGTNQFEKKLVSILDANDIPNHFINEQYRFKMILPKGWYYAIESTHQTELISSFRFDYTDRESNMEFDWIALYIRRNVTNRAGNSLTDCELSSEDQTSEANDGINKLIKIIGSGAMIVDNTFACYIDYENTGGLNRTILIHRSDNPEWECKIQTHFMGKNSESQLEAINNMLRKSFKFL